MAKIFVSTVEKTAHIAVIEVNPYLISKAIRTEITLENIKKNCERTQTTTDPETGEEVVKVTYRDYAGEENVKKLIEEVLPFIVELTAAFEE
jgi:hypothetical protein